MIFETNDNWEFKSPLLKVFSPGCRTYYMFEVVSNIPLLHINLKLKEGKEAYWKHFIMADVPNALRLINAKKAITDFAISLLIPAIKNCEFDKYVIKEVEKIFEAEVDTKETTKQISYLYLFTDGTQYFDFDDEEKKIKNKKLIFFKEK